jgi:hypothetical protein
MRHGMCKLCPTTDDNTNTPNVKVIYYILFSLTQYRKSTHIIKIEIQIYALHLTIYDQLNDHHVTRGATSAAFSTRD